METPIGDLCLIAALSGDGLDELRQRVNAQAASGVDLTEALAEGWGAAVVEAMEDHSLSSREIGSLNNYRNQFGLSRAQLDRDGCFELFEIMVLLHHIRTKRTVPTFDINAATIALGQLPVNFMKTEESVLLFDNVEYRPRVVERVQVTNRDLLFGGSKRTTYESASIEAKDIGILIVTTKNLYFNGRHEKIKRPFTKLPFIEPVETGIQIQRDGVTAQPEIFVIGKHKGLLTYAIIEALLGVGSVPKRTIGPETLDELVEGEKLTAKQRERLFEDELQRSRARQKQMTVTNASSCLFYALGIAGLLAGGAGLATLGATALVRLAAGGF